MSISTGNWNLPAQNYEMFGSCYRAASNHMLFSPSDELTEKIVIFIKRTKTIRNKIGWGKNIFKKPQKAQSSVPVIFISEMKLVPCWYQRE